MLMPGALPTATVQQRPPGQGEEAGDAMESGVLAVAKGPYRWICLQDQFLIVEVLWLAGALCDLCREQTSATAGHVSCSIVCTLKSLDRRD
jgi:hypothetical protein